MITLEPIDAHNRDECIALSVAPDQKKWIMDNIDSLTLSGKDPLIEPFGIMEDGVMIGFFMIGFDEEQDIYLAHRFMIDQRYQKQGKGREGFRLMCELVRARGKEKMRLLYKPDNLIVGKLVATYGFMPTGDKVNGETMLEMIFH